MQDYKNLLIYQKAEQLLKLTEALCTTIPEDDIVMNGIKGYMWENVITIMAKIAGAEGADLYDLRMENAAIIRKAARELYVEAGGLKAPGQSEYAGLLRAEVEEFRLLFVDWVRGFDKWNYINDNWGLFNPPGIEPE